MKVKTEMDMMQLKPRNARVPASHQVLGKGHGTDPCLTALRRIPPWSLTSGLQNSETIKFCCVSHPVYTVFCSVSPRKLIPLVCFLSSSSPISLRRQLWCCVSCSLELGGSPGTISGCYRLGGWSFFPGCLCNSGFIKYVIWWVRAWILESQLPEFKSQFYHLVAL